jgi:hypothetical protein
MRKIDFTLIVCLLIGQNVYSNSINGISYLIKCNNDIHSKKYPQCNHSCSCIVMQDNLINTNKEVSVSQKDTPAIGEIPYTEIESLENGLFKVNHDGKWGIIDTNGVVIVDPKYDGIGQYNLDGLIIVLRNNKWGYINSEGKEIIEPKYDAIGNGTFRIKSFTDKKGITTMRYFKGIPIQPVKIQELVVNFNNKLITVEFMNKWGCINTDGKEVVEPKYDWIGSFANRNLAIVRLNNKWGIIEANGHEIVKPQYDRIGDPPWDFFNRYAVAIVEKNKKWGLINTKGKEIVTPKYDKILDSYMLLTNLEMYTIELNGKYGFINAEGNEIIEPKYDEVKNFSQSGISEVTLNGKKGIVTITGIEIVEPKYDALAVPYSYPNGLIGFKLYGKWGFLDKNGKTVVESKYDMIDGSSKNGVTVIKVHDKWGLIDINGKEIVEPKHDEIKFDLKGFIGIDKGFFNRNTQYDWNGTKL